MPLRQHDVVLAEGRFQIVLTDRRRLFAVIDAPETALGPLRIALEIDRRARRVDPATLRRAGGDEFVVAGLFDDIGHAISHVASDIGHGVAHAAEGAFNAVSKVATTVARPVFNTVRDVSASAMHLISQHLPFLPEAARKSIESASRIVMRARLGDLTAKDFIHGVVSAVRSGVQGARAIGDALLTGSRLVAHVLDVPMRLMEHIPGVGGVMQNFSPFAKFEKMTSLVQKGDFGGLKRMVTDDVKMAQGVISLIPGIGTGISAGLSAGMAILDGGGALEIAIKTAYGAIPIPPGLRTITDAVLDGVLQLAAKGGSLTDAAVAAARDAVPSGFVRDVFDTLANLVVKKHPPAHVAGELLDHYVKKFTTAGVAEPSGHAADVAQVLRSARFVQPLGRIFVPADVEAPVSTALVLP